MSSSYLTANFDRVAAVRADSTAQETSKLKAYYRAVAEDFRAWSRDLNMHFGYWGRGVNPLDREAMLDRMNLEMLNRLNLAQDQPALLADLGCGAGATARTIARQRKQIKIDAVTIVMEQILQGAALNQVAGVRDQIRFRLAEFTDTGLPAAQYDGVYALESSCHARGADKRLLIAEIHRLLKPGGTVVITDAFLRNPAPLPPMLERIYRSWCTNWAVSELAEVSATRRALERQGFVDVKFQDISWRIAPSALQIPLFATRFAIRELWRARLQMDAWRKGHILASYAAFVLGCWLPRFGYFIVTARKPA